MSGDARAVAARQYHTSANRAEEEAAKFRQLRDHLIRELKTEGWTNHNLAAAIGCTEGNIRHILKGEPK